MSGSIRKGVGSLFKVGLITIGLFDIVGLLPPSLDILDKGLAALILFFFWMGLRPGSFLFGVKNKVLDAAIITTFYILVSDTFIHIVRTSEEILTLSFVANRPWLTSFLASLLSSEHATQISILSSQLGFVALLLITIILTFAVRYTKPSVLASVLSFLRLDLFRKEVSQSYRESASTRTRLILPLKAALTLLVLLLVHQYFFSLVNQWFIISLDKSLLILAILFAVKDLEHTKSQVLNTIGQFDEWLLGTITTLFTDPKRLHLGLGILLLFHYLSDLSVFFLPFLFPFIDIEPFYATLLSESSHTAFITLFNGESYLFFIEWIFSGMTYLLSGLGTLIMIFFPLVILYGLMTSIDFSHLIKKKWYRFSLIFGTLSVLVALALTLVTMRSITGKGIVGVNFLTQPLSVHGYPFLVTGLLVIFIGILIYFLIQSERSVSLATFFLYLISLIYLGLYCWNFFVSSISYHVLSIQLLLANGFLMLSTMLMFLLVLEFIFYIGLFVVLAYTSLLYLSRQLIQRILSDRLVLSWIIILLLIPVIILSPTVHLTFAAFFDRIMLATIIIGVLLIWSRALYTILRGSEYRDDLTLSVALTLGVYLVLLIISFILNALALDQGVINFLHPFFLIILAVVLLQIFNHSWVFHSRRYRSGHYGVALTIGFGFGLLFYILREPTSVLFSYHIGVILLYTLLIALGEEIIFRLTIFRLACKAFGFRKGLVLQGIVFSLIHLGSLSYLYLHYKNLTGIASSYPVLFIVAYVSGLFFFSIVLGLIIRREEITGEGPVSLGPVILIHWITNLIAISLTVF